MQGDPNPTLKCAGNDELHLPPLPRLRAWFLPRYNTPGWGACLRLIGAVKSPSSDEVLSDDLLSAYSRSTVLGELIAVHRSFWPWRLYCDGSFHHSKDAQRKQMRRKPQLINFMDLSKVSQTRRVCISRAPYHITLKIGMCKKRLCGAFDSKKAVKLGESPCPHQYGKNSPETC